MIRALLAQRPDEASPIDHTWARLQEIVA